MVTSDERSGEVAESVALRRRVAELEQRLAERERAAEDVRRSEALLSVVFNNGQDLQLLVRVEPGGQLRVAAVNQRYLDVIRSFGYALSSEQIVGLSVPELGRVFGLSGELEEQTLAHYQRVATTGEPVRYEENLETPHGHYSGEISLVPVKDPAGACAFILYTSHDITPSRRAEAALRESEERFAVFMDNLPAGAFMKSESGEVVYANRYLCELFGWGRPVGQRTRELLPSDGARMEEDDRLALARGQLTIVETIVDSAQRERVFQTHKFAIARAGRSPLLGGIAIDLTERQRGEREREQLQAQLAQAQKLESIGRLAGGVAHDFNNKLSVILCNADLALAQADPASELAAELREIKLAAEHSADLTRQLLAFARKQTVAPQVLDLNDAITASLKMLRRLLGEEVELCWTPGEGIDPIRMDPSQLDQILTNLCLNARDALSAPGGRIAIATAVRTLDAAEVEAHEAAPGTYAVLTVSDNGAGMDGETLASLFEPFFTTKALGRGTGLGLSSVLGIVKQNGGHITVESEPGQGSTFRVYLPCLGDKRTEADAAALTASGGRETILLVEDELSILKVMTRMLAGLGYAVVAAAGPGEALRLAREHRGSLHLLITDVVMPEMNGRDLARNVRALHPEIRCLFTSGYTADVIAHRGVLESGVHFMQKPFSMKALAEKVRAALEG